MSVKHNPSVFIASVIVSCLVLGAALAIFFVETVPSLVVSVLLACSVATLLYGILGGVSAAGFDLGPLKMGGSAAVLLGSVWYFNTALDPQLERIRYERRIAQFDFEELAAPSDGWFAINENTGVPVAVAFTEPVTGEVIETVGTPNSVSLLLKLASGESNERYLVMGTDAVAGQAIGYVPVGDLIEIIGSIGLQPGTIYGPQRLYLTAESELPPGMERRWGNTECRGGNMPFEIEVVRFHEFTDYDLRRCDDAEGAEAYYSSSLDNDAGELLELTIEDRRRRFLIAVVGADHRPPQERPDSNEPPWSSFLVIEMESSS